MRKALFTLTCLAAMLALGTGLRAQEITITLSQGWNWISYPNAEIMQVGEALGSFAPMEGDMIKSNFGVSTYVNGRWRGGVTHFMPGWGYKYYSLRAEDVDFVFAQAASSNVSTATPTDVTATSAVAGGMVILPEGSHVFLRGVCWGTEPGPDIDGDHTLEDTGIGSFSSTLEGLNPNTTYYVRAYVVSDHGLVYGNEVSFTTEAFHTYVDLGLPSGTLWATCNVGANLPEDYGDYFAWGETQPKDSYSWDNYLYGSGYNQLTKYCYDSYYGYNGFADTLTVLLPEDDAVTANWGTDWRMPNNAEWNELYYYTTKTQTTQNGVYGTLFTGENGNSIFLPAAGCWYNESPNDVGQFGYYWSNKLYNNYPSASYYYTCNPNGTYYLNFIYDRFVGRSVRAVRTVPLATYTINATANPEEAGWVIGADSYREGAECTLVAEAYEEYIFINWTEDGEVVSTDATYSFIVTGNRNLVANFVINDGTYHEYVDLGLPSGLLWATCNVGADNPGDYGDYFAWGETQPKSIYNWSTYQYCNGSYNTLTKYCNNSSYGYNGFTDDLTTLEPSDDAATANWGDDWRMPTEEEWQELYQNTTVTWTTRNGVNGRLFTASNGNSLFLPASGYRNESTPEATGIIGDYWTSSLDTDYPSGALSFFFNSSNYYISFCNRLYGRNVRAVRTGSQSTSFVIDATANPVEGGVVIGGGSYQMGAECTLNATASEGYTFINWTENGEMVSMESVFTFTVTESRSIVANFAVNPSWPNGVLPGYFSVSSTRQVQFSQGNLQYIGSAATPYWKFAESQWDCLGSAQNGAGQGKDRDLFGWGTSGWNNGNYYYRPWDTSWDSEGRYRGFGYGPYNGTGAYFDLTGSYANSDWGVNNSISNGGNRTVQWRTLTGDEWNYVFNTRTTPSGIRYAKANVNDVNGVILLPDDWDANSYSLSNTNSSNASFSSNILTASQWSILEQAGAVFLPAAGQRYPYDLSQGLTAYVSNVGSNGYYWSTTSASITVKSIYRAAKTLSFSDSMLNSDASSSGLYMGYSVRLVHNAQ